MEQKLQKLGLTLKEAKIYLALLELGDATITEIASKSGVGRTSVYDNIVKLVKDGLVVQISGKKIEAYRAEPAEKLPLIIENRLRAMNQRLAYAKSLVNELNLVSSKQPTKPKVSLFEGPKGIKSLYEDTLLSSEPIVAFSSTEYLESFDPKYLHNYYERRAQKGVFIQAIINDEHGYQELDKKLLREIRVVPKKMMDIRPEIYIYENKVAIFSLKEEYGVLIESYDIADALKKLYNLAWLKAGELDKEIKEKRKLA